MFKRRSRRLSTKPSETKSIDQLSFGIVEATLI
jgi:hypothetical protein